MANASPNPNKCGNVPMGCCPQGWPSTLYLKITTSCTAIPTTAIPLTYNWGSGVWIGEFTAGSCGQLYAHLDGASCNPVVSIVKEIPSGNPCVTGTLLQPAPQCPFVSASFSSATWNPSGQSCSCCSSVNVDFLLTASP